MSIPELEHDRVHEPRDDPRWRESYYFSFFDWDSGIGGFTSIGKRPAKGHAGSINCIWGPGIPTLVASEYGGIEGHADDHVVAGLRYGGNEPFGPWKLSFEGLLNDGGSGVECDYGALGPTARSAARKAFVRYVLTFTPTYEPYLYEQREEWRDLFDGHIDEVGTVEGELEVDDQLIRIRGRGAKDHSWGVRDWFKPAAWRWMDVLSLEGPELALWRARFNGEWVEDGAVYVPRDVAGLTSYAERIAHAERERKPLPTAIEFEAEAGGERLAARGEVIRVVPIFFGRDVDGDRETSWNDRALVRFETETGAVAWANVEFESLLRERVEARTRG